MGAQRHVMGKNPPPQKMMSLGLGVIEQAVMCGFESGNSQNPAWLRKRGVGAIDDDRGRAVIFRVAKWMDVGKRDGFRC